MEDRASRDAIHPDGWRADTFPPAIVTRLNRVSVTGRSGSSGPVRWHLGAGTARKGGLSIYSSWTSVPLRPWEPPGGACSLVSTRPSELESPCSEAPPPSAVPAPPLWASLQPESLVLTAGALVTSTGFASMSSIEFQLSLRSNAAWTPRPADTIANSVTIAVLAFIRDRFGICVRTPLPTTRLHCICRPGLPFGQGMGCRARMLVSLDTAPALDFLKR